MWGRGGYSTEEGKKGFNYNFFYVVWSTLEKSKEDRSSGSILESFNQLKWSDMKKGENTTGVY